MLRRWQAIYRLVVPVLTNHRLIKLLRKEVQRATLWRQFNIKSVLLGNSTGSAEGLDDHRPLLIRIISSSTSPVQKLITNEKGVAIDFDSVSQDSKAQSKELYTWGQVESDDLRDGN